METVGVMIKLAGPVPVAVTAALAEFNRRSYCRGYTPAVVVLNPKDRPAEYSREGLKIKTDKTLAPGYIRVLSADDEETEAPVAI